MGSISADRDATCMGCGIDTESAESLFCNDCREIDIENSDLIRSLPGLWARDIPDFVTAERAQRLHHCYRTFIVCQNREPEDSNVLADHFDGASGEACTPCWRYAKERYEANREMPPLFMIDIYNVHGESESAG